MSVGIALVMSFKFNIHMSLLMQSIMLPLGLLENLVLKKYIFGYFVKPNPNDRIYRELDAPPTQAVINAINAANIAAAGSSEATTTANITSSSSSSSSSSSGSNSKTDEDSDAKKGSKTTAASDLD
jgi:hypothetical protein